MKIARNEVPEFRYSSSIPTSNESFLDIGTVDTSETVVRITDIKMTCRGTAVNVKFYCSSYGTAGQALEFDMPANSAYSMHWEIPPRFHIVASTLENRNMVASADGTGLRYSISGYTE